jgi:NAD+ synthase (glutamine-hydrolysing)
MKIALAQINPTIGDFDGNLARVFEQAEQARAEGAELCIFPEMCITGYPSLDLLERSSYIDRNLECLDRIVNEVTGIAVIVGYVSRTPSGVGKQLYNSAALISDGRIVSTHTKMLLPTYDVFNEQRYFEPASAVTVVEFAGKKLGISICEDIWNEPGFWPKRLYERDPIAELVDQGAEILINISASPFTTKKRNLRHEMLRSVAVSHGRPLLFVNQVGANDDLVFDGRSLAFDARGELLAIGAEFQEDLVMVDLDSAANSLTHDPLTDDEATLEALVLGTRDYASKCGFTSAALGLSGGIDSALAAVIGVRALGPENVHGVALPSCYSSPGSLTDAEALATSLGMPFRVIPIEALRLEFLDALATQFKDTTPDVTEENIQARIRGTILMALSNKFGHLLLSTGNKSELATGYCTLYGDMAGGLSVLCDVPKTLVYRLAREINRDEEIIPDSILTKPPSAELRPDQLDQDSLPPYDILDGILEGYIEDGLDLEQLVARGFERSLVADVIGLVVRNEHKRRQAALGPKITIKAFGPGRRIPLAKRWSG